MSTIKHLVKKGDVCIWTRNGIEKGEVQVAEEPSENSEMITVKREGGHEKFRVHFSELQPQDR